MTQVSQKNSAHDFFPWRHEVFEEDVRGSPEVTPACETCAGPNWSAEDDVGGDDDFLKLLLIVYTIDGWLLKRLVVGHFYVNSW